MKNFKKISSLISKHAIYLLIAVIVGATATYAVGSLQPSDSPSKTQYSLNDIYEKLSDFSASTTESTGALIVPGSVSASVHTLAEIMGLLKDEDSDLVPENIKSGSTIFGVEGSLEGEHVLEWQAPAVGSEYPSRYMCWSSDVVTCPEYNKTAEGYGAKEYCENLPDDGGGWRLPTYAELLNASPVGEAPVDGFVDGNAYWAITEYYDAYDIGKYAVRINVTTAGSGSGTKDNGYYVRCVR